jgi:hypothetical protein
MRMFPRPTLKGVDVEPEPGTDAATTDPEADEEALALGL